MAMVMMMMVTMTMVMMVKMNMMKMMIMLMMMMMMMTMVMMMKMMRKVMMMMTTMVMIMFMKLKMMIMLMMMMMMKLKMMMNAIFGFTKRARDLSAHNAHAFCFYITRTHFVQLNRARVLFKFKNLFPPNDKTEPPPMLSWNSYAYVSALYFASDSTCLCLGV